MRIENATDRQLFLGSAEDDCAGNLDLFLSDADGEIGFQGGSCTAICEIYRGGAPECPAYCAAPPTILVVPGGSWETTWNGNVYQEADMPEGCYGEQTAPDSCYQYVVAPSGPYSFRALAWDDPTNCVDENCSCTPDVNGSCTVEAWGAVTGTPIEASASFSYPSDDIVVIRFE